jgi:ferrous iron transport protein B
MSLNSRIGAPEAPERSRRILILGLPNSGKTRLANDLSGAYGIVSNYALTTVEPARHACTVEGQASEIIDSPGMHGLYLQSAEELPSRDLLFSGCPPDAIVQCVDSHRLRESLLLTADLMDLEIPLILFLTAVGESERDGLRIDAGALARRVGVPVVRSLRAGHGVAEVRRLLLRLPDPPAPIPFTGDLEQAVTRAASLLPPATARPRASAILLLENDPSFAPPDVRASLSPVRASLGGRPTVMASVQRGRWVDEVSRRATSRSEARPRGFSDAFARVCRHPIFGLPILAGFLGLLYVMVVSVAGGLSLFLTTAITDPVVAEVGRLVPAGLLRDLLVGPQGVLTLGLFNSLTTVLPILSVFFLVFGLLEDVGYLPNLAILTRRLASKLGITGNAVIPLVLGLGCKTMATMTARSIPSRKEKLIVIALIAFAIPCSAQMGLSIAILGQHGFGWFAAAFTVLALAELGVGMLLNRLMPADAPDDFIQELPPLRLPRLGALARKTGHRLLWFLREAIPIFLVASLALFVLERTGLLGVIKAAVSPVITGLLGLPIDMVNVLLLTLARSEAAAGLVLQMSRQGLLTGPQSVVAVVMLTTFAQCFANIGAIVREAGARTAVVIVASVYAGSFVVSAAAHGVLLLLAPLVGS